MSDGDDDSSDNIIAGPVLIVIAILVLWYNEGRFDHSRAASRTVAVSSLENVTPARTASYTGILGECLIRERYLLPFAGYYQVSGMAEIYSWEMDTDDDGDVSWSEGWHSFRQDNTRNEGFAQQLRSVSAAAETLRLDDLEIRPATLHFADASILIPPESVTLGARGEALHLSPEGEYFYIRKRLGFENQLGDERIRYEGIPVSQTATYFGVIQDSTAVGQQFDIQSGFASRFINELIKNDGVLHHLVNGTRGEALRTMRSHHRKLKWTVRLAGTAGLVVGFHLILSEFVHLLLAIPLVGGLARVGALLTSLILGLAISFLTIFAGVAFNHPVAVLVSLALVSLVITLLVREGRKVKANARRNLMRTRGPDVELPSRRVVLAQANDEGDRVHKVFRNLAKLALIDGTYGKRENKFLTSWGSSMGLADETMQALFEAARTDPRIGLDATAHQDLEPLISLALVDGHLSSNELHHILGFGRRLGMDGNQVRAEITRIQRGEQA